MNHFGEIRAKLAERGLDAMLLTCEANRFYASGFHSAGTDGVALVTREGAYYFIDSRYIEAAEKLVQDAAIRMTDIKNPYLDLINEVVGREKIAVMGFEETYLTVAGRRGYGKLRCRLKPAAALMAGLRASKDEEELRRMEKAQRIAEKALAETLPLIRPGVTEKEVAAEIVYRMLRNGAEKVSFDPIVVSGPNTSLPHGVPTTRKIKSGEFVTLDIGCICEGYCSDMTRTVAVGSASDEMRKIYAIVLEAQLAGIAHARAGAVGSRIDAAARDVIGRAGYGAYFGHGFGHSLGVEIHEAPNASPSEKKKLPAGAVISAEPGIYLPGRFGVRIEDVVILREDGCKVLTRAPKKELIIL
jgi:Xaa-Pro aminopeptidase